MAKPVQAGGSFAPPFTDEMLQEYAVLIAACANRQVKDILTRLHGMAIAFRKQPAAEGSGTPHASGRGIVVSLDDAVVQAIWDYVPYQNECVAYVPTLDSIDPITEKPLRDAAFHLLWLAQELTLDRSPMTKDLL